MTNTCPYTPDQANYVIGSRQAGAVIGVQLDGGLSATRLDKLGAATVVQVTWSLSLAKGDFAALDTFWRNNMAVPFFIPLIIDGSGNAASTYTAKFVPDTYGLQSAQGDTYIVQAQLEVG